MSVFISFGSNLGDRFTSIINALKIINKKFELIAVSNLYETAPIGLEGNNFYNCVASLNTNLSPYDLLDELKSIERELGRDSSQGHNMPRVIDLDILLYNDRVINSEKLIIPHPRLIERPFFIKCLIEIEPLLKDPLTGKTFESIFRTYNNKAGWNKINKFPLHTLI